MAKTVEQLYQEAGELLVRSKALLEQSGELTDQQKNDINAWVAQSDEIKARAKSLQSVLDAEIEMKTYAAEKQVAAQEAAQEKQSKDAGFKHGFEFMKSLFDYRVNGLYDPRIEKLLVTKDMSAEIGITGGVLVPTEQRAEILAARAEASFVRSRAKIVPMGSLTVDFPAIDYGRGAAGVSAFFGGIRTYHVEENASIAESQPYFKAKTLHAHEIGGYVEIPNSLIKHSPISLEAFLSGPGSFGGALAWQEDYDALRGDGVGKATGILGCAGAGTVSRGTATTFKYADAVSMVAKMVLSGSPVWVINQSVMPQLYNMVDGTSGLIWQPSAVVGKPDTLLGYPVHWTEKTPVLGTAGDVMLIDFAWYLFGDVPGIAMEVSREHKFQTNQTAFRAVEAFDGLPWLDAAIKLADGTTTVSPYVTLS